MSTSTKDARGGLGEDARILLRLIGKNTRLQFTTGEVLALHPRHLRRPRPVPWASAARRQQARRRRGASAPAWR